MNTEKSIFIQGRLDRATSAHGKRSLRPSHGALTFPPEQGTRPVGQDQSAARGTWLQDIITHLGLWVEGAGEVRGGAVSDLGQLTERGLLDTACSKGAAGSVLGRPPGTVTSAGSSEKTGLRGGLSRQAHAQDSQGCPVGKAQEKQRGSDSWGEGGVQNRGSMWLRIKAEPNRVRGEQCRRERVKLHRIDAGPARRQPGSLVQRPLDGQTL